MYQEFDTIDQAKEKFKRCRTDKDFILSDKGVAKLDPTCYRCGEKISVDHAPSEYKGNRCVYKATSKQVIILHYTCAWDNTLSTIFKPEKLY